MVYFSVSFSSCDLCYKIQDETLVHCSLSHLENPDFIFDVEFDSMIHEVCIYNYVRYYVASVPGDHYQLTKVIY